MNNQDAWPPLLSARQMHEAVETTITWANRTLERYNEMQGCAVQMRGHAMMLRDFAWRQMDAGQQHLFQCEDRERLRQRLRQMKTTMDVTALFMTKVQREALGPLIAIADQCDAVDEECVSVIYHDDNEANDPTVP